MITFIKRWKILLDKVIRKVENIKIEQKELSGNVIVNEKKQINLSDIFDMRRLKYDYGIKLKNDNLVKVKSELLVIDENGELYFIDQRKNEPIEVGQVDEYLYEYDIYKQEWKKADVSRLLISANFSIKNNKLKEVNKKILENRNCDLYNDIFNHYKNFKLGGIIENGR